MLPSFLIGLVIGLIIVGLLLWVIEQIPMDPTIARIIRVVIIVGVCLWLIYVLAGFMPNGPSYPIRR